MDVEQIIKDGRCILDWQLHLNVMPDWSGLLVTLRYKNGCKPSENRTRSVIDEFQSADYQFLGRSWIGTMVRLCFTHKGESDANKKSEPK